MPGFVDTHTHLFFPEYEEDRLEVIKRAQDAGIAKFVNVGTDVGTSKASLDLASEYPFVWATAGIHPHDAKDADEAAFQAIESLLDNSRMVAVGEVGLDFFRDHSPHDVQIDVFKRFIKMAKRLNKPLVIHCRDAYDKLVEILKAESDEKYQGVIHCFSSDKNIMEQLVGLGFHISFAGPLTYKKNDVLREACRACPLDRLLLETDAPFLPPQSMRGKRNESGYLLETAEVMAELHGKSISELAEITTRNAETVFNLC